MANETTATIQHLDGLRFELTITTGDGENPGSGFFLRNESEGLLVVTANIEATGAELSSHSFVHGEATIIVLTQFEGDDAQAPGDPIRLYQNFIHNPIGNNPLFTWPADEDEEDGGNGGGGADPYVTPMIM